MVLLILLTSIALFLVTRSFRDTLSRRVFLSFVLLWTVVLLLSCANPYDLKPVSDKVYLLMLVYMISFVGGASINKNKPISPQQEQNLSFGDSVNKIVNSKWFILVYLALLYGAFFLFRKQQVIILSYNLGYLREGFYQLMFEGQPLLAALYNYVLAPFFYIIIALECYMLLYNRKWGKIVLFFPYIIVYGVLAGGRIRFMAVIIFLAFMLLMGPVLGFDKKYEKKSLKYVLIVVAVFVGIISVMSMFRAGESELSSDGLTVGLNRFSEQIVVYSVGSLRAFDQAIQNDFVSRIGGFQLGQATFCGVEKFLEPLLRHGLGITIDSGYDRTVGFLQEEVLDIGAHHYEEFNFAYTSAFIHYLDFGVLGVFLFPFIFGFITRQMFIRLQLRVTGGRVVINAIVFYTIIYSVFTFFLVNGYAIEVILLMWLYDKFLAK